MKNLFASQDDRWTDPPTQKITETDPADTTQEGRRHRWLEGKLSLRDEISRKHEEGFVRNGKAKNPQHEQGEECPVAILTDPRECGFHRLSVSSD